MSADSCSEWSGSSCSGADRIADAVAVMYLYGGPACVIDFGTATTFNALTKEGEYLGGAITAGINLATEALFVNAAKLPRIDLQRPPSVIGRNTVHAMQAGLLFGYVSMVEGMVEVLGGAEVERFSTLADRAQRLAIPVTAGKQHVSIPLDAAGGHALLTSRPACRGQDTEQVGVGVVPVAEPTNMPIPRTDPRIPSVLAPPSNVSRASTGKMTCQLYSRVPITAIIVNKVASTGTLRT